MILTGGKLIDKGMYGCIFTPALKCKNAPDTLDADDDMIDTSPTVTKLILTDSANNEYFISKAIRQIPLWKNYFIVSESICDPAPVQKDKDLDKCELLSDYTLSDFKLLTMPYGGTSLTTYRIDINKFDFMKFVIHIIEAGAILNLFGVVHRDIHQGNILIDTSQIPRIIDFNLAISVSANNVSNKLDHMYNYATAQEPPDSTLVNAISLGYNPERVIDSIINKKPILKKIRNILQIQANEQKEELETFYKTSKSVKSGNNAKWFTTYWRTIDSWAIAVNIIDLLSKLSLWNEFYVKLDRIRPLLFPVLTKMCHTNPLKRIDCVQALHALDPNSFIIRKYSKSWLNKVGY